MPTATQAILAAWSPPFGLTVGVILVSAIYVRGWNAIRKTRPRYFGSARLACFLSGMAILWLAIASPIDGFADVLLSAHMVQHFLLMSAVPPLVLLGAPVVPLLRGLPRWVIKRFLGPLIAQRWLDDHDAQCRHGWQRWRAAGRPWHGRRWRVSVRAR